MLLTEIDHVAIAVRDLARARELDVPGAVITDVPMDVVEADDVAALIVGVRVFGDVVADSAAEFFHGLVGLSLAGV